MGPRFSRKESKLAKNIKKYIKQRARDKKILSEQIEKLENQLEDNTIDELTHERLRDLLEVNFMKQREETLGFILNNY